MSVQTMSGLTETSTPGIYEESELETTEAENPLFDLRDREWKDTTVIWGPRPVYQTVYYPVVSIRRFQQLADQWLEDTINMSSIAARAAHPAYLEIIGMGEKAVPLLLNELEKRPSHWFIALTAITGQNPIPEEARGRFKEMTEAWLEWGRENNYI